MSNFIVDEDEYIALLQQRVQQLALPLLIEKDKSYADVEEIKKQGFDIIVVLSGLKYMFSRNGFNQKKIIYVDYNDYCTKKVSPTVARIIQALGE